MKRKTIEDIYPLSPLQQGLLFHTLYAPKSGIYVEQFCCTLRGDLDVAAFRESFRQVIDRHTALRTAYRWQDLDQPLQVVHRHAELPFEEHDWRTAAAVRQQEWLADYVRTDRDRGFVLSRAPLLRGALFRVADDAFDMVLSNHHIVTDGWSMAILIKEVLAIYEAACQGRELNLPRSLPYRDYIAWLQAQELAQAETYWRKMLGGVATATPLGVDRARPGQDATSESGSSPEQEVRLTVAESAALQEFARRYQLTLNTVIQGAWALLLSRYSGQSDVVFGTTVSGRAGALDGIESMVGLFINTLPVRVRLSGQAQLLPWLRDLQAQLVELRQYEFSPLAEVQHWSDVPRGQPLFESTVVFENYPLEGGLLSSKGGLRVESVRLLERTNYPLSLVAEPGEELLLRVCYDARRFDDDAIARILGHLQTLLKGLVADPARTLSAVPLLPQAEREQVLVRWNATAVELTVDRPAHELFEAQVGRTPTATALTCGDTHLTYQELNARANRLARRLRALGVGPEQRVGLCVSRSPAMVVGLLGVLKAGGAYVPLDPEYPPARLAFMLEDARVAVLLTETRLVETLPQPEAARVLCLDDQAESHEGWDDANLAGGATLEDLAYVIYTSGSTGTPKGVMVTHGGLTNYLAWVARAYPVDGGHGAPVHSSLSFDLTVTSLFAPLCGGRRVDLLDESLGVEQLAEALRREHDYSLVKITPAHLQLLSLQLAPEEAAGRTRAFIIGGESLMAEQVEFWRLWAPETRLVNEYGPTETVVGCCVYQVPIDAPRAGPIPIGRPIANTGVYVLDASGEPVPIGVAGELHVGGRGVARGYLARPALTAQRFVPDPFGAAPGGRLYRTGDLARWRADGVLEFLGRGDDQVKVRGYRIELGEVEAVLARHPAVREVVVVARRDEPGEVRLVAYIVAAAADSVGTGWRQWLRERLPDPMIPALFVVLDELPLSPNGKLDRKALPAPNPTTDSPVEAYVAPRNPEEERLAQIAGDVLKREPVGAHDNLFDLGLDSILSIQIVSRARQAGLHLNPKDVFQHPTIAALATLAGTEAVIDTDPSPVVHPLPLTPPAWIDWAVRDRLIASEPLIEDLYPLTPAQAGMLFHSQFDPDSGVYLQQFTCVLHGELDIEAFERAWRGIVDRHAALRTAFPTFDSTRPLQAVYRQVLLPIEPHDWRGVAREEQVERLDAYLEAERRRGFDLSRAPLLRLGLIRIAADAHHLVWTCHHVLLDGWCLPILLDEVLTSYEAFRRGEEYELPLRRPYREYIAWLLAQDSAVAEDYWRRTLAGFVDPTPLAIDRAVVPDAYAPVLHAVLKCQLSAMATAALQAQARANELTLNTLLQGAWALLLSRYSGRTDVVFGQAVSGRPAELAGVESMIGLFINTLPVRVFVALEVPLLKWLRELQDDQMEQRQYESTSLVTLQGYSDVPRGRPLFESILVFENYPIDAALPARAGRLGVTDLRFLEQSHYPLTLFVVPGGEMLLRVGYDARRFEEATIERLLGHLRTLLEGLATGLDRRLADLPMLTAAEQEQLLRQFNGVRPETALNEGGHVVAGRIVSEVDRLSDAELDSLLGTLLLEPEGDWS